MHGYTYIHTHAHIHIQVRPFIFPQTFVTFVTSSFLTLSWHRSSLDSTRAHLRHKTESPWSKPHSECSHPLLYPQSSVLYNECIDLGPCASTGLFTTDHGFVVGPEQIHDLNPLPTIGNSLKKQKSLYKVLTPSIKPPYIYYYGSSWRLYASLVSCTDLAISRHRPPPPPPNGIYREKCVGSVKFQNGKTRAIR